MIENFGFFDLMAELSFADKVFDSSACTHMLPNDPIINEIATNRTNVLENLFI